MQSRRAAFTALRRLAFNDLRPVLRPLPKHALPAPRPLHYSATCLHSPEQSLEIPQQTPQPSLKPHAPRAPVLSQQPAYEMTFTCKPCSTRSTHRVTKQAYHHGSVLITCPECKNRHIISDHLKIFTDEGTTIEDLMQAKGQLVKKGSLSEDGDLEFWDDGTTASRAEINGTSKGGH